MWVESESVCGLRYRRRAWPPAEAAMMEAEWRKPTTYSEWWEEEQPLGPTVAQAEERDRPPEQGATLEPSAWAASPAGRARTVPANDLDFGRAFDSPFVVAQRLRGFEAWAPVAKQWVSAPRCERRSALRPPRAAQAEPLPLQSSAVWAQVFAEASARQSAAPPLPGEERRTRDLTSPADPAVQWRGNASKPRTPPGRGSGQAEAESGRSRRSPARAEIRGTTQRQDVPN